jgi:GTP-binding protein
MTQTKYVLSKALSHNLKPIVVLNKMDRDTIRVDEVENEVRKFDLAELSFLLLRNLINSQSIG